MTVPNDAGGSLALAEQIQHLCAKHDVDQVKVALEATGVYAWHLAVFLSGLDALGSHKPQVFVLQPRAVKHYRESFGSKKPKSDGADRLLLARILGHRELLPRPFRFDDRTLPLQRLTRHRYHVVRQLVRNKNYAASYLFLKASTLAQTRALSDPFGVAASEILLEYCTAEDIAQASVDELVGVLNRAAKGKIADPAAIALAYKRAAQDAHTLPERLKQPVHQILSLTIQDIRHLDHQIEAVDRLIDREPIARNNRLRSIPGIGPVFAAGILAEIGRIENFPSDDALAQYAGLTWPEHQSGDFAAEDTPLARTGNVYLRHYFVAAANSVRQHDAGFAAYYAKKYDEAAEHKHKRAQVLTARKLLRLAFALLRDDRAYDPTHVPTRRRVAT